MKGFVFPAYCEFGRGDIGETRVSAVLTDEEAERLVTIGKEAYENGDSFEECGELSDIYDQIYSIASEQITEELRDWGDLEEDQKAGDLYSIRVGFPPNFKPEPD